MAVMREGVEMQTSSRAFAVRYAMTYIVGFQIPGLRYRDTCTARANMAETRVNT